jgi:hypothetical protein
MMHLTLSCDVHYFEIVQRIFGQSENDDQRVLFGYASSCVSFVRGFDSVTLLFSVTLILGV